MKKDTHSAVELRFVSDGALVNLGGGRFLKDVIPEGNWQYTAVQKDPATGAERRVRKVLGVTLDRLRHWGETLAAMRAAGHRIPFPLDHDVDHSERNLGFIERFFARPDEKHPGRFIGTAELADVPDDSGVGKTIQEVSISVHEGSWTDGAGRVWNDFIHHIAPCIKPVVPGQGNFVTLKQDTSQPARGGSEMEALIALLKEMGAADVTAENALAKAAEMLGISAEGLTAEDAVAKLKAKQAEADAAASAAAQAGTELKQLRLERDALKREVVNLKDVAAKANVKVELREPTPEEVQLRQEVTQLRQVNVDAEVGAMLKDAKIVSADVPLVKAMLMGVGPSGVVNLKEGSTEISLSPADALRRVIRNLPKGAALSAAQRLKGAVELKEPREPGGDADRVDLRERQAKRAREIAKEEHIDLAEAQQRAEVELRDKD